MPYAVLERKLKTLPEQSFAEVDGFFDYIIYKFGRKPTEETESSSQSGMNLLDSIVGIVPQDVSIEQAKKDYFGEKYGTAH